MDSRWYVPEGSPVARWAEGIAWLWRLGPRAAGPSARAVGFGSAEDAAELEALVRERRVAGAVLAVSGSGEAAGQVPARRVSSGTARFAGSVRVDGDFPVFAAGEAVVTSSRGTHAVRAGRVLALGIDPAASWGGVADFWAYEAISGFLAELLEGPLVVLPPLGCARLDDTPGTAQQQLQGTASGDARQARRLRRLGGAYERAGAVLNLAVAAEAFDDSRRVPLDRVWPDAVAAIGEGVGAGAFEPVLHGLLHLDTAELDAGRVEFREFASLSLDDARARIDRALTWQREHLGEPHTFVAPAWSYGAAGRQAAAARGLPCWLRCEPGPLRDAGDARETLKGHLPGLHRLDYRPLARLAAAGVPPVVVLHGWLFDARQAALRTPGGLLTLARLFLSRDISRLARLSGVRWVGAGEMVERIAAHDRVEVTGTEVSGASDGAILVDSEGTRPIGPAT